MSLSSNITTLATRIATEFKTVKTILSGNNQGDLTALTTTDKSSLLGAINEVAASASSASGIDDGTTSTTTTWSSNKISTELAAKPEIDDVTPSTTTVYSSSETDSKIATAKSDILGGASAAYDTLLELENAVGSNDSAISGLTTSIGEKVSYTTDQSATITGTQKGIARTNIGAAADADLSALSTAVGDTAADFAGTFVAGLA